MEPDYVGDRGGGQSESLGEKLLESQFVLNNHHTRGDDEEHKKL